MSYLGILALLSLLIVIHEAGHLAAARLAGIPVARFAVGFGPALWTVRRGGIEYSLRAIPLGGYVAPAVEDDAAFRAFPLGRRLAFFLGGPLANLAAALPLLAVRNAMEGGLSLWGVLVAPFLQVGMACRGMLDALAGLASRPETLSGVVGIVVQGSRLSAAGLALEVAISLTLSLAVMNLLPIPVLDGGQIVMACLEKAFPRAIRLRVPLTVLGLLVLAAIMVYANVQDVVRYWG